MLLLLCLHLHIFMPLLSGLGAYCTFLFLSVHLSNGNFSNLALKFIWTEGWTDQILALKGRWSIVDRNMRVVSLYTNYEIVEGKRLSTPGQN